LRTSKYQSLEHYIHQPFQHQAMSLSTSTISLPNIKPSAFQTSNHQPSKHQTISLPTIQTSAFQTFNHQPSKHQTISLPNIKPSAFQTSNHQPSKHRIISFSKHNLLF
jgi:hypothetical protein